MKRREFLRCTGRLLAGWAVLTGTAFWHRPAWAERESSDAGRLAIIIDDIGRSPRRLQRFLSLRIPLVFSVLPRLTHSRRCAHMVLDNGNDLFLHQPMEAYSRRYDPGPGAVYVHDDDATIGRVIADNLAALPPVLGVNNHMGSRFTSRPDKMRPALTTLRSRGLVFVDSLTSSRSAAYGEARKLGVPALRRHVFLDNDRSEKAIFNQLVALRRLAAARGFAVGIGHPHRQTCSAIAAFRDRYGNGDITMVPISTIAGHRPGAVHG